jgi:hypothetical protein
MNDLILALKTVAAKASRSDAVIIEAAIKRIQELEEKVADWEDDITDWQVEVKRQMGRKKD